MMERGGSSEESGRAFPPLSRPPQTTPQPSLSPPPLSSSSSSSSSSSPFLLDPFPRFPFISSKGISEAGDEFWEAYLRAIDAEADRGRC